MGLAIYIVYLPTLVILSTLAIFIGKKLLFQTEKSAKPPWQEVISFLLGAVSAVASSFLIASLVHFKGPTDFLESTEFS